MPSQTRRTNFDTLRDELIRSFQNPDNLDDTSPFFESVPKSSAHHNFLPSTATPPFELSDLPSPLSPIQPSLPHSTPLTPQQLAMSDHGDASTAVKPLMPLKGDRGAPTFNPDHPSKLSRFFCQLEALFLCSGITSNEEKKDYVISYIDASLANLWEGIPSFKSATATYDQFKAAILKCYMDNDRKYNVSDLDMLIGECQRLGIHSLNELSEYHLCFKAVTLYLLERELIGEVEQFNAFVRSFSPAFWTDISRRLQVKHPDHYPDFPYKISKVYDAAHFILHGLPTGSSAIPIPAFPLQQPSPSSVSYTPPPLQPVDLPSTIKSEQLGSILIEFTKSIVKAIKQVNMSDNNRLSSSPNFWRSTSCNMCRKEHFIRDCEVVMEYIHAGKCRCNTEGKVVLPSGSFIPRDIPGTLLHDRFDKWHHRNPNQLASGTLFHSVISSDNVPHSPPSQPLYQLSTTDRITSLEAELFNLRTRKPGFTPVTRTRVQKARNANVDPDDDLAPVQPPVISETDQHVPHLSHRHRCPLSHLSQRDQNIPFGTHRMQPTSPLKIETLAHFLSLLLRRNLSLHTKPYHQFIINLSPLMSTIIHLTCPSLSLNVNSCPFLLKSKHNLGMLSQHTVFQIRTLLSKISSMNLLLTLKTTSLLSYLIPLFLHVSINILPLVPPSSPIISKLIFAR